MVVGPSGCEVCPCDVHIHLVACGGVHRTDVVQRLYNIYMINIFGGTTFTFWRSTIRRYESRRSPAARASWRSPAAGRAVPGPGAMAAALRPTAARRATGARSHRRTRDGAISSINSSARVAVSFGILYNRWWIKIVERHAEKTAPLPEATAHQRARAPSDLGLPAGTEVLLQRLRGRAFSNSGRHYRGGTRTPAPGSGRPPFAARARFAGQRTRPSGGRSAAEHGSCGRQRVSLSRLVLIFIGCGI